jgi:hypothetical protein
MGLVTVMEMCRRMNVEPTPDLCVSVGQTVARLYKSETGREPERPLQPKTRGGGTHCIAAYPESFAERTGEAIRTYGAEAARQTSFAFDSPTQATATGNE